MKKTGLIGLGVISQHILNGLNYSKFLKLVAFADIDKKAKDKFYEHELSFFTDYIEMLKKQKLDYVIIATPPHTHYEIIKNCLSKDINVSVEKPAVLDLIQWDELTKLANDEQLTFEVIYHWQNGEEVKEFLKCFNPTGLKKIKISSNDPYSTDGKTAIRDRIRLGGSWIDSGVNILSLLKLFLPFNSYKIIKVENVLCKNSQIPIASKVELIIDRIVVEIDIDWRNNLNQKISEFIYLDKKIVLHHSNQSIIIEDKEDVCSTEVRLNTHYKNYFSKFNGKSDLDAGRKIHEILLKVREY